LGIVEAAGEGSGFAKLSGAADGDGSGWDCAVSTFFAQEQRKRKKVKQKKKILILTDLIPLWNIKNFR